MLNALHPDSFPIVNNKSLRVTNHFAGTKHKRGLIAYPETIQGIKSLVGDLDDVIGDSGRTGISSVDLFDMFSHWMVAEKKYFEDEKDENFAYGRSPLESKLSSGTNAATTVLLRWAGTTLGMSPL